jgi:hypothetical protein
MALVSDPWWYLESAFIVIFSPDPRMRSPAAPVLQRPPPCETLYAAKPIVSGVSISLRSISGTFAMVLTLHLDDAHAVCPQHQADLVIAQPTLEYPL